MLKIVKSKLKQILLKMKRIQSLFFVLIAVNCFFFNACNKDKSEDPPLADLSIVDMSQDTEFDYWVVSKDGSNFFAKIENSKPEYVFFTPEVGKEGYPIYFDNDGLPDKMLIDGYTFVFRNFEGTKVDIAVIYPDGTIDIAREIETGVDLSSISLKSSSSSDWIRWTGHVVGVAACGVGIAALPATFGLSTVLVYVGCGATAVSISTELLPEDYEVLGLSASGVGAVATVAGCVNPTDIGGKVSCVLGLSSTGMGAVSMGVEHFEENEEDLNVATSALEYGYGDVQITLRWTNTADLDLHVLDPNGEEIYWDNDYSSSGGRLDVDDINGYGPENIYWPKNEAPNGNYEVHVHHYPWTDSEFQEVTGLSSYPTTSSFTVLVNAFGTIKKFTGSISFDQSKHIANFDQTGLKSMELKNTTITTKGKKKTKM